MAVNKTRRKTVNNPLILGRGTINKQIFSNLRNVRNSLGLVEEMFSGEQFPSGGIAKGIPRILGKETGTAPLGRGRLEWLTLASSLHPSNCNKSVGQGGKDKGIENWPLPVPKQFDPCGPGKNRSLWPPVLLECLLGTKVGKGHNLQKNLKQDPALCGAWRNSRSPSSWGLWQRQIWWYLLPITNTGQTCKSQGH